MWIVARAIPSRDIREPVFRQGKGGERDAVHPGNDQFIPGDRIERPPGGAGGGAGEGQASPMVKGKTISFSKSQKMSI